MKRIIFLLLLIVSFAAKSQTTDVWDNGVFRNKLSIPVYDTSVTKGDSTVLFGVDKYDTSRFVYWVKNRWNIAIAFNNNTTNFSNKNYIVNTPAVNAENTYNLPSILVDSDKAVNINRLIISRKDTKSGIVLSNTGTDGEDWHLFSTNSASSSGAGKLIINPTNSSSNGLLSLDGVNSRIGIGTSNPDSKFTIFGSDNKISLKYNTQYYFNARVGDGGSFIQNLYNTSGTPKLHAYRWYIDDYKTVEVDTIGTFVYGNLNVAGSLLVHDTTVSSDFTPTKYDNIILVNATSGNVTITLPSSSLLFSNSNSKDGRKYTTGYRIIRMDNSANTVTVAAASGETFLGGTTSYAIDGYKESTLLSVGNTTWKYKLED